MKKKLLCLITVLSIPLFGCAINNSDSSKTNSNENSYDSENPWDNMGGGGIGNDISESGNDNSSIKLPDDLENVDDENFYTNEDNAIIINLNVLNAVTNDYYTYANDILTIQKEGIYELSGLLNGAVVINSDIQNTKIILNNASIFTTETQNVAAITFEKTSALRVLTIKDSSINVLKDSIGDDANGKNAIINSKASSLTINGKGILNLESNGIKTTAIKTKNTLNIYDSTININTSNNGIKADERIYLKNASINIKNAKDGIKTDIEASTEEEGNEYTSNPYCGYIHIENTNLDINSSDDGVSANSLLYIKNSNDNLIKIVTNNGAPATVTEQSSDTCDGKALKAGGIKLVVNEVETDLPSQCEDNYRLIIDGGNFEINSNDDAITSKGNLTINDGNFNIATGDDAIHAEYLTKIINGNIKITKSYEGIEGASVEIYGGTIDLIATDDGINAANKDLKNWQNNIYIGGGDILVNAQGDGVDSNGTIDFSGGKTIIYGPTANDNGSLDADNGILVKGGILFAFGSSGMVETPSSNSTQACIVYNANKTISANTKFSMKDSENNTLYELTPTKQYQSIVISTPDLVNNKSFTITVGNTNNTITISGILNKIGKTFGPGSGGGGHGGGMPW